MKIVFHNPEFSFQLLRTMGHTVYGGADIGECLSTAYHIEESLPMIMHNLSKGIKEQNHE